MLRPARCPAARRVARARWVGRAAALGLTALVLAVGLSLGLAGPASAHAVVTSASPADRTSQPTAPAEVRISFSESVSSSLGGLQVLDGDGNRVDTGSDQPSADTLRAPLRSGLADGTYIANYRIVSADGHAITGAIVFGVGVSVDEGRAAGVAQKSDPVLEGLGAATRFLAFAGSLGAAGLAFALAFVGDGGPGTTACGRRVRRLAGVGAIGLATGIVVQCALATGRGLGAVADPDVLREVLTGGLGWQAAVVLAGLAAVVIVPATSDIVAQVLGLYGGLATAGGFVLWGHAAEARDKWLTMTADVVHAAAAATWLGGLILLTVLLRHRMADRADPADADYVEAPVLATARVVVGFSTLAAISVALLWIAGTAMAWQTVGTPGNLIEGGYGRALLVKFGIVVAILVIAAINRFRLVPRIVDDAEPRTSGTASGAPAEVEVDGDGSTDGIDPLGPVEAPVPADPRPEPEPVAVSASPEPAWGTLVRTLRLEAIGVVVVLAVTGLLVNLTPAGLAQATADQPFTQKAALRSGGNVDIVLSPALTGVNSLHLTYSGADGRPADLVRSAKVSFSLPDKGIAPISREPIKAATGHFILDGLTDFAVAGTWTITVESRTSEFDVERTEFQVPIKKA